MNGLGVIFDMDGVLVDSYRAHLESWQQAAGRFGVSMSEQDFARTFGRTSREVIRQLWPDRFGAESAAAEVAAFDVEKERMYREVLRRRFPEMDGAGELIRALHAAGFHLAIGSSGPAENVATVKECLRDGNLISATVHGGDVKRGKPDPEVFLTAAGKLGLEPGRCAVIEDATVGVEAARRAGMAAVALTGTASREALAERAHLVVASLRELTPTVIADVVRRNGEG